MADADAEWNIGNQRARPNLHPTAPEGVPSGAIPRRRDDARANRIVEIAVLT
jgi:hypothetical protein